METQEAKDLKAVPVQMILIPALVLLDKIEKHLRNLVWASVAFGVVLLVRGWV